MTNKEIIEKLEKVNKIMGWMLYGNERLTYTLLDRAMQPLREAIAALKAEQPLEQREHIGWWYPERRKFAKTELSYHEHHIPVYTIEKIKGNEQSVEQPKCETCGGSGKVPSEYGLTQCSSLPISPFNTKPCPDCPLKGYAGLCPSEKAGEFTKEARRQLDIGVNVLDGFLREACDIIDSLQTKLATTRLNRNEFFDETVKLQAEIDKLRGITHGDSAIAIIEGLEAELAEKEKRIEGLEKVFGMDEPWSLLICAKQLVMSANHLLNDHNCDGDGYEKTEIAKRQMEKYIIRVEQAPKAEQKGK